MSEHRSEIVEQISRWATDAPGRPAIGDRVGVVTYGQVWQEASTCARILKRHAAKAGDAVGLVLPNQALFIAALLGTARIGAVAVLFPTSLEATDLQQYVETAGTRLVLTGPSHCSLLADAGGRPVPESDLDLRPFAFNVFATAKLASSDFIVQLTSGADQPSKLAIRTHAAVWGEISDFAEEIDLTERDSTLPLSSIFHSYGLIGGTLAPLCRGGRVDLQERFDPHDALRVITQRHPTILFAVPVTYRALIRARPQPSEDLSSLRLCFSAGAPLPGDVDEEFARRCGRRISQDYGSTEVGVITVRLQWAPHLQNSVGRPIRGRTITIVDPRGSALGPGQVGEVIVRSSALARTYLGPASGERIIEGDPFMTGDLGWMDEDGYLFLTGRKTSLIHAGSVSINPAEVEAVIAVIPGVYDVAVVGVPDHDGGERVKAVVAAEGIGAEDILRHCRQHLAASHLPQVIEFRDRIPRTPAGKIIRRALRQGPPQHHAVME